MDITSMDLLVDAYNYCPSFLHKKAKVRTCQSSDAIPIMELGCRVYTTRYTKHNILSVLNK